MCFSATASFTAGIGLSCIGVATLCKTKKRSDILLASIPLLFGIQQLAEGIIWLSIGRSVFLVSTATIIYLIFSHIIWPTLLPLAVLCIEKTVWRQHILWLFVGIGLIVSGYFLYYLQIETVTTSIVERCIAYRSPHFQNTFLLSPYTTATCLSCLFSSHRLINVFGIVAFIAAIIASAFFYHAFISVWCFFGAILSVMIYWYVASHVEPRQS